MNYKINYKKRKKKLPYKSMTNDTKAIPTEIKIEVNQFYFDWKVTKDPIIKPKSKIKVLEFWLSVISIITNILSILFSTATPIFVVFLPYFSIKIEFGDIIRFLLWWLNHL